MQIETVVAVQKKENIYINKHSGSLEELAVFTLLENNAPNTYLSIQILDEVLKKK